MRRVTAKNLNSKSNLVIRSFLNCAITRNVHTNSSMNREREGERQINEGSQ